MPRPRTNDPNVRLSKKLTRILRHKAEEEGFTLDKGGFLYVDDLLRSKHFFGVDTETIKSIVENCNKQRFTLETDADTGRLKIRANQGHTLQIDDLDLKAITDADEFLVVVHGTNPKAYRFIESEGLKTMGRNHIHFATGEPGENGVISGMRNSCTVMIYLNLQEALKDGLQFFLSANNVVLCPGNEDGTILPKYFSKVKNRQSGSTMPFKQHASEKQTSEKGTIEKQTSGIQPQENTAQADLPTVTTPMTSVTSVTPMTVTDDDLADEMDRQRKEKRRKSKKTS